MRSFLSAWLTKSISMLCSGTGVILDLLALLEQSCNSKLLRKVLSLEPPSASELTTRKRTYSSWLDRIRAPPPPSVPSIFDKKPPIEVLGSSSSISLSFCCD